MVNENIKKKDMELILEVNKKAIEIETEVADQNEEIILSLKEIKKTQVDQDKKIDKLVENSDEHRKDLFKIQILFLTGLVSLAIQIIQIISRR